MTSKPKRWVIKPFSPKLEQSDLHSILSTTGQPQSSEDMWSSSHDSESLRFRFDSILVTGMQATVMVSPGSGENTPDVVVQARQVAVSEDGCESENWRPSSPSNLSSPGTPSSTGSYVGFYSFVDDPTSPEAEMNEAHMVSPERLALKENNSFKLQTYSEETRPGRLFQETNGDAPYRVEDVSKIHEEEENPDRMDIIRSQVPRKSSALKEQWSALEILDLSNTPQRLLDGFSLCYNPASSKSQQASAEPSAIDNEQIDFNAARKQFLMMDKSKQNMFLQSPQQLTCSPKLRGRTLSPMASIFTPKQLSKEYTPRENQVPLRTQQEVEKLTVIMTEDPEDGVQSGAIDDIDSGLGDRSGGYASDGSISNDPTISEMGSSLSVPSAGETPIEREIRIAQEREENLRRLRGILHTGHSEIVEIKTKPILPQSYPQLKPPKAKETNRVSFLVQRELDLEKRRQSHNRVLSLQSKENQGEAQDKRIKFETQPEVQITSLRISPRESPTNDLQQRNVSVVETAEKPVLIDEDDRSDSEEVLSPCCTHRHTDESMLQRNYSESSSFGNQDIKVHITANLEENFHSKVRFYKENVFETQTSSLRTKKLPSWIAENGTSMSGRDRISSPNILSPLEPTKTRYVPTWRSHLECTSWCPQIQNAPDSIRQEIEQDLRREQELQELRESSSHSFSEPISAPMTPVESRPLPTSSEETLSSPQSMQKYMMDVEEKKTDYSYPNSWNLNPSQISMADINSQLSTTRLSSRLPSVSIMTPQPWGSSKPMPPTSSRVTSIKPLNPLADMSSTLSQKGLTETLLKDFEDRQVKLKLEESAYAGIQPIDDINNEVVEATRVTRHKNQRALQWEAGMYTNQESK
ncbi:mitotic interactor and substrate of PLK1-like isoform X2 [Myxocyprinus asiaticus]|nr:mitotic interactor and substrate of PLK1-like isoform X2 [Myxocyprinus asiaticus]XP_051531557.1 mitotic interactor and substrate of PLK1-like isoform X2 [Myxocyprinus asiaticus]XP_051531558.1 mitotic interactor and substrate of PLK1-like isoform X2 [Myxocyprinus asiaticus]XP_051531559.1 mitotic interactor and substrate of PLK1-like isoform X2 [Myxocyprinus asiaticus]